MCYHAYGIHWKWAMFFLFSTEKYWITRNLVMVCRYIHERIDYFYCWKLRANEHFHVLSDWTHEKSYKHLISTEIPCQKKILCPKMSTITIGCKYRQKKHSIKIDLRLLLHFSLYISLTIIISDGQIKAFHIVNA